jgi:multidrug efflux pump
MVLIYGGLIALTVFGFSRVPVGFIPQQDKGYLVVNAQLPEGASLDRTDAVVRKITEIAQADDAVGHVIGLPGYSVLTSNNISNAGGMFIILKPFEERAGNRRLSADALAARMRAACYEQIEEARVGVFGAPPVDGLGSTGGFKLQIQDRSGGTLEALEGAVANVAEKGNAQPGLTGLFSTFSANQPQIYVDVDRVKAQREGVDLDVVYDTLQIYLGSAYVNDITLDNRNWQVNVQSDAFFRVRPADVGKLKVRNVKGDMIPLSTVISIRETNGPAIVNHYNLYPSAEINGNTKPGTSSGQAIEAMDEVTKRELPKTMGKEWTELSFQQIKASEDLLTKLIFPLAVVFVFMVLSAQYESWSLPAAILLIVPMCLLSAIVGVWLAGLDNNIFVQIGLVVLVGLAAKNAILIVEFAKQREEEGLDLIDATVDACKQRLRPILMTSFAFILGVMPLMFAKGAGAEMRVGLGIAVFSGMLGVTIFGLGFTPVFYVLIRRLGGTKKPAPQAPPSHGPKEPIVSAAVATPTDGAAIQTAPGHHPA